MVKLGVVIPTHNNPMFLRTTLLQLEAQTLRPDVVAIHENGHPDSALHWSCKDILERWQQKVIILHDHTPAGLAHPFFHYLPLKRLVEAHCDLFTKMDHDDIFYSSHLETLKMQLQWYGAAWVGQRRADILILNPAQYSYHKQVDFGQFNPLGGMSDSFMFTRDVAIQYMQDMIDRAGTNEADDWILHEYTLPRFAREGRMLETEGTTCYVSHGRNDSTSHWIRQAPAELKVVDK